MGCGASRMDPGREAVASQFPPRLRLRFEEIKRKRIAAATAGTLSKKKLLKEADLSVYQASADDTSLSSHEESMRTAKVAPEPESIQEEDESNNSVEEETDVEKEGANEEDNDEEGRISNVGDGYICPRSPSFRVYCAEALKPINSDTTDDDVDKKERDDRGEIVAPLNFNEEVSEKAIEKGKRQRKRKSNAVKHLLKIKSCYYPSCTGHHNARLITQKTAA